MTIEKLPQGNRNPSGKWPWILLAGLIVLMLAMFYNPPRTVADRALTDAEKCAGATTLQCYEQLALERRRREFAESPAGQDMLRAAEATQGR